MAKQFAYTQNQQGIVTMSFDEYMRIVKICELIDDNSTNLDFDEMRLVFSSRDQWPTVHDLEFLEAGKNFAQMFPYLVYYYEVYTTEDAGFEKTKKYLHDLFERKLHISD